MVANATNMSLNRKANNLSTNLTTRLEVTIYRTHKGNAQRWCINVNTNMYMSKMECMREDQYSLIEFD